MSATLNTCCFFSDVLPVSSRGPLDLPREGGKAAGKGGKGADKAGKGAKGGGAVPGEGEEKKAPAPVPPMQVWFVVVLWMVGRVLVHRARVTPRPRAGEWMARSGG